MNSAVVPILGWGVLVLRNLTRGRSRPLRLLAAGPPRCRKQFRPACEQLEPRTLPTAFTTTSPTTLGALPVGITPVGGIVLDLVGANGNRVVSQLAATSLFKGFFERRTPSEFQGNPGTIGVQTGFTPATLEALGGGLAEAAVRLTVFDGNTAAGNFDYHHNELLLNGLDFGDFSDVPTEETSQDGTATLSTNLGGGFRNDKLDTGFFFSADRQMLDRLLASMAATGEVRFQLRDVDPFDNFFDFTQGLDGGLVNVGRPPTVANRPPQITRITDGGAVEGAPVLVSVEASDPDGAGQPLTYQFDFDNDGVYEVSTAAPAVSHTFVKAGKYVVNVRLLDADGAEARGSTTVAVRNVAPRLEGLSLPARATAGRAVALAGEFTDPGVLDSFTLAIDWGDGTTTALDLPAGSRSFEQAHTYRAAGPADVVPRLVDDSGGADVGTASVNVVSPSPAPVQASINLVSSPPRGGVEPAANSSVPQTPLPSPRVAQTTDGKIAGNLVRVALRAGNDAKGLSPSVTPANPDDTAGRVAELNRGRVTAVEVRPALPILFSNPLVGGGEREVSSSVPQTPLQRLRAALTAGGEAVRNLVRAALGAGMEAQGQALQLLGQAQSGLEVLGPPIRLAVGPQDPPAVQPVANVVPRAAPPSPNPSPPRKDPEHAGGRRRGLGAARTTLLALIFLVLYQHWQRSKMAASAILHRRWASRVPARSALYGPRALD